MGLTSAAVAGIVVAIILLLSTIIAAMGIYLHRRRTIRAGKRVDDEQQQRHLPHQEEEWHLPGPSHSAHRKRNPTTFYDWVRSPNADPSTAAFLPPSSTALPPLVVNENRPQGTGAGVGAGEHEQKHSRYLSLENGPGPIIHSEPMLQTRPPSNPNRFSISNRDERPGTSGSNTSLRRAVLNIAAVETKRESVLAEKKMREGKAKDEAKMRPRGYSGAWP